ncbi:MAG TPA: aspartate kinase [Alphaproteobacteria bacterium]|nr:aspartate kinase [Alphaproteobacteria bacterium]
MADPPSQHGTEAPTPRNGSGDDGGDWVVLKFGGTSVSSVERWRTIADQIRRRRREGLRPLVVCSALSQVSNQLEGLLSQAAAGEDVGSRVERLRETHRGLAAALGVDVEEAFEELLPELERVLLGITLTHEVTPRLRARVLSTGELLSTRIGVAWLQSQGVRAVWQDARELLEAEPEPQTAVSEERQFLSATCSDDLDPALEARLRALDADVIVTQGFLARGPDGETVLLGRGGSDTSAAYLAARLGARRLEIWTDVPGLFSANPGRVPEARLLRRLGYAEASEFAGRGAKILHPRCLGPVRRHGIPLHVRCTRWPEVEGTVIEDRRAHGHPGILGIASRTDLELVSMDVEASWQQVGVIADVTGCFKRLGLSVDLLASSQSNVTLTLDPSANELSEPVIDALRQELSEIGTPHFEGAAASVSLVGTSIADVLHELGPLLENFEHENVHLVSHASNDLSFTVVVDQKAADQLVPALHGKLFASRQADGDLGPTWQELEAQAGRAEPARGVH